MEELALKIEHVSKEYRLGTIGGGTLKAELQSKWAKFRKREDPNKKIGAKEYNPNETFLALDDVSLEIHKGERVGIIGHNGAGKSTLLKLICRVTTPSIGNIYMNGRITSMLEVGTGFHGELTGKENIYLNGAILGMSKEEINSKFDEIVSFSEVGQFINTPTKRYSSGMKVKLGFAVASHLDSEILIMDEVLAVGDVAFQDKCIDQMNRLATETNKTIIYVSHNMSTVRKLCDRCIVLDHGHIVFDGDVEKAIEIYSPKSEDEESVYFDTSDRKQAKKVNWHHKINSLEFPDRDNNRFEYGEKITFRINYESFFDEELKMKMVVYQQNVAPAGLLFGGNLPCSVGKHTVDYSLDSKNFIPGNYSMAIKFYRESVNGTVEYYDQTQAMVFKIIHSDNSVSLRNWSSDWGNVILPGLEITDKE